MQKDLPPLKALVAFEASVRYGSFKHAAVELHITPGAISQQVRKLEDWLGYPLFARETRKLKVTERGMEYYSRIAPALEQIGSASEAYRSDTENKVCLSLTQTLASKWLGPRLEHFVSQHPDIEVHINASNKTVDFRNDAVDLAIRHFDGQDANLESQMVFDDEICLFCTPDYLASKGVKHIDQLNRATLIVTTVQPFWNKWLAEFSSITEEESKQIARLHFDQTLLAIDAARRNQGVVLCSALLVKEELKRNELIEPFKQRLAIEKSYYLVHPRKQPLSQAASILRKWLLEQFCAQP